MYSSGITFTGVTAAGAAGSMSGANNGASISSVDATKIVLGQDTGNPGNIAQLISDREIPFAGHQLTLINLLNNAAIQNFISFFATGQAPFGIIQNGTGSIAVGNAGYFQFFQPVNYNQTYASPLAPGGTIRMDRWYMNYQLGDNNEAGAGMPDAVLNIGYNMALSNGRLNPLDASWRLGFETNFAGLAGGFGLDFEFHLPEITLFNGDIVRTNSYYVNKTTGFCFYQGYIDQWQLFTVMQGGAPGIGREYARFSADNSGSIASLELIGDGLSASAAARIRLTDLAAANSFDIDHLGNFMFIEPNGTLVHAFDTHGNVYLNQNPANVSDSLGITMLGNKFSDFDPPDASALLQMYSTRQGFLMPAMTTAQKLAIPAPATGLQVIDTTLLHPAYFNGTRWINQKDLYSGGFTQVVVATTTFTVSIGVNIGSTAYQVTVTPTVLLAAAVFYVTNKTNTTFDVVYLAGLTGTVNFDWVVYF